MIHSNGSGYGFGSHLASGTQFSLYTDNGRLSNWFLHFKMCRYPCPFCSAIFTGLPFFVVIIVHIQWVTAGQTTTIKRALRDEVCACNASTSWWYSAILLSSPPFSPLLSLALSLSHFLSLSLSIVVVVNVPSHSFITAYKWRKFLVGYFYN